MQQWAQHRQQVKEQRVADRHRAAQDAHKAAQQSYQMELVSVSDLSLQSFEALPRSLLDAESILDQAELNFMEEAFAPFWDSIEQATLHLGHFDDCVSSISHNLNRYGELSKVYESNPPRFPIALDSVKAMVAGNTTADRLKVIVRQAQRNFQFASIYEQRRTNQILLAGFNTLAQALEGMGRRISKSIDELSTQVSEMSTSINEMSTSINEMSTSINESISSLGEQMVVVNQSIVGVSESVRELHSTIQKEAYEQSERHHRALEMLDNIQRRRKPSGLFF